VGDFLRVGSVCVVVIETHDGVENRVLSEEKIQNHEGHDEQRGILDPRTHPCFLAWGMPAHTTSPGVLRTAGTIAPVAEENP
jgi:hypothetical protein